MAEKKAKPQRVADESQKSEFNSLNMSCGNLRTKDYAPVKTSGIKMRGGGAATKGTTCRGPMA